MLAGHIGVALAVGSTHRRVNVGVFIAAALLLDFILWLFVLLGIESVSIPADFETTRQVAFVFAYSHGLLAAAVWSVATVTEAYVRPLFHAKADRLRAKFRKLAELMDSAENEVLAYMAFPKSHWSQIHSTNPIERLNREIKRRTNVVSIFPNEEAIVRLVGAILLEQNDEWAVSRRYMSLETLAGICDDPRVRSNAIPAA